jgi:hypothetical protein
MLRVLLACLVLWLGTGTAARVAPWNDAIVAVAEIRSSCASSSRVESASPRAPQTIARRPAMLRSLRVTIAPHDAERAHQPVRDVYLRTCVLLC